MCQYFILHSFLDHSHEISGPTDVNQMLLKAELVFGSVLTNVCGLIGNLLFIKEYVVAALQLPIVLNLTENA